MSTKAKLGKSHASSALAKDIFILKQLVSKDFKLKYRRSVLGVVWSVLNPLLMMVVMSIVFSYMFGGSVENFPLYLIVGNVTFSLMSDSTNAALWSIIDAAPLLKKVKVDRFVFPVQKVIFALVNFAFSLIAVAFVMLVQGCSHLASRHASRGSRPPHALLHRHRSRHRFPCGFLQGHYSPLGSHHFGLDVSDPYLLGSSAFDR